MKKRTLFQDLHLICLLLYLTLFSVCAALIAFYLADLPKTPVRLVPALIFLILILVLVFVLVNLRPRARHLKALCRRFADGEIHQDFVREIGDLFPGLGEDIARFDNLLDRQNIMQLSTKQAEFLALQNQINPHFLYNTLESIRGDALAAGVSSIADITEALSTFFRYTITETRNLVTIGEELDNVESYFVIQQYRFGDKLKMQVEIADDRPYILSLQCPKLFLQPIIENAIFHGLERRAEHGLVTIRIEIVDSDVHIDISDNGVGIEESRLHRLNQSLSRASVGAIVETGENKKGGIALKNVCRRIKLLFGEHYGLHISSIVGIGTKVKVVLPITRREDPVHEA